MIGKEEALEGLGKVVMAKEAAALLECCRLAPSRVDVSPSGECAVLYAFGQGVRANTSVAALFRTDGTVRAEFSPDGGLFTQLPEGETDAASLALDIERTIFGPLLDRSNPLALRALEEDLFVRDIQIDIVYCPAGAAMTRKSTKKDGRGRYIAKRSCYVCPLRCFGDGARWKEIDFTPGCAEKGKKPRPFPPSGAVKILLRP